MEFDWHDEESARNLALRGFGFDFAALMVLGRPLLRTDLRRDYGEVRVNAIGEIDGRIFHVTLTDRGRVRCIVSARLASRKERELWHASA